jgi:hypothetical protein
LPEPELVASCARGAGAGGSMVGILDSNDIELENRMTEILFTVEEAPEGGFTARAVGHSIFTEADTLDELRQNVREAVECHFDDGQGPKLIRLHIVRDEVLTV